MIKVFTIIFLVSLISTIISSILNHFRLKTNKYLENKVKNSFLKVFLHRILAFLLVIFMLPNAISLVLNVVFYLQVIFEFILDKQYQELINVIKLILFLIISIMFFIITTIFILKCRKNIEKKNHYLNRLFGSQKYEYSDDSFGIEGNFYLLNIFIIFTFNFVFFLILVLNELLLL